MAAPASDADDEVVFAGHDAAFARGDMAHGHTRDVVRTVDFIDRKALKQPVVHHGACAAPMLFGRLEDEAHRAVEVTAFAQ